MSIGAFSSESQTKKATSNQQQTAADQALNLSNRHSGNFKPHLAKGSTLNIGLGADEVAAALASALGAAGLGGTGDDKQDAILAQRLSDNETAAQDAIKADSTSTHFKLIGAAVAIVAVIAAVIIFRRKN